MAIDQRRVEWRLFTGSSSVGLQKRFCGAMKRFSIASSLAGEMAMRQYQTLVHLQSGARVQTYTHMRGSCFGFREPLCRIFSLLYPRRHSINSLHLVVT